VGVFRWKKPMRIAVILLIATFALFAITYISLFCHELGHAVAARMSGFVVTSFGIGVRPPAWVSQWWGTRVFLGRPWSFQGIAFWFHPQLYPRRRCLLWALAGGILGQFALALLAGTLCFLLPSGPLFVLCIQIAAQNSLWGLLNFVPFTVRVHNATLRTDGGQMLQLLRGQGIALGMATRIQISKSFRDFWLAIGDRTILYFWLQQSAAAWLELENAGRALALCEEAEALCIDHTIFTRAFGAYIRSNVLAAAGRDEAGPALDEAEKGFREMKNEAGLLLVDLQRGLLLAKQDPPGALARLTEVADHPLVIRERSLRTLVSHLRQLLQAQSNNDPEMLLAKQEDPSPASELRTCSAAARMYAKREDWERAEDAYAKARVAAQTIIQEFHDESDRQCFIQGKQALLDDINTCLRARGKKGIERLELLSPQEATLRIAAARQERNHRCQRWGLIIAGLNLLTLVAVIAAVWLLRERFRPGPMHHEKLAFFLVVLLLTQVPLGGFSVAYAAMSLIVGPFSQTLRQRGGPVTLFFALLPWIVWLFLLPAVLFMP
jgi:tetratricopeptide (TPR) repeat protein